MKEVSKTAFFCCGCRMADADSPYPIVGDYFAKTLMGAEGLQYWKVFESVPRPIISNQIRHYLIENHLRRRLSQDPEVTIVHIGAGLDTRPFRMHGGHWVEIDAPEILAYKEGLLPAANCRNPLQRIPIQFESEQLADKLAPFTKRNNIVFVVEGVLMYLTQAQRVEQLQTLTKHFPRHHYICELMTREFLQKLAKPFNDILIKQGTSFVELQQEPTAMFNQAGYRQLNRMSTLDAGLQLGRFGKQRFLMSLMPKRLRDGYAVYEFVYGA